MRIAGCFTREDAHPWLDEAWVRLGFDRDDPADHSPVERAVLRGLGVARLDYRPAAPREDVVPERVRRQERMREEEQARLAEAAS